MSEPFHIEGAWPGIVSLRRGWGRAIVRPWNKTTGLGAMRLVRGTSSFLASATEWTAHEASSDVLSPALYRSATRIWNRVGYEPMLELAIMETTLGAVQKTSERVAPLSGSDLGRLESIDRQSFDRFWHLESVGLKEAIEATPRATVLQAVVDNDMVGYAVVGTQLGVSFLQRIAVVPEHQGNGIGHDLIAASKSWARGTGAVTMVLNVRAENDGARRLYTREGFADTGAKLRVLRYRA